MITGELRNQVDKLWTEFWTGGITNPLMVIEQISFLMFARLLDIRETREEKKTGRTGKNFNRIFPPGKQNLRWSQFRNVTPATEMLRLVRDEVFPHFKEVVLNGGALAEYMKDAQMMIQKPSLLVSESTSNRSPSSLVLTAQAKAPSFRPFTMPLKSLNAATSILTKH